MHLCLPAALPCPAPLPRPLFRVVELSGDSGEATVIIEQHDTVSLSNFISSNVMHTTWQILYRASLKGMYVFKFDCILRPVSRHQPLTEDSIWILATQDQPVSGALYSFLLKLNFLLGTILLWRVEYPLKRVKEFRVVFSFLFDDILKQLDHTVTTDRDCAPPSLQSLLRTSRKGTPSARGQVVELWMVVGQAAAFCFSLVFPICID